MTYWTECPLYFTLLVESPDLGDAVYDVGSECLFVYFTNVLVPGTAKIPNVLVAQDGNHQIIIRTRESPHLRGARIHQQTPVCAWIARLVVCLA